MRVQKGAASAACSAAQAREKVIQCHVRFLRLRFKLDLRFFLLSRCRRCKYLLIFFVSRCRFNEYFSALSRWCVGGGRRFLFEDVFIDFLIYIFICFNIFIYFYIFNFFIYFLIYERIYFFA